VGRSAIASMSLGNAAALTPTSARRGDTWQPRARQDRIGRSAVTIEIVQAIVSRARYPLVRMDLPEGQVKMVDETVAVEVAVVQVDLRRPQRDAIPGNRIAAADQRKVRGLIVAVPSPGSTVNRTWVPAVAPTRPPTTVNSQAMKRAQSVTPVLLATEMAPASSICPLADSTSPCWKTEKSSRTSHFQWSYNQRIERMSTDPPTTP